MTQAAKQSKVMDTYRAMHPKSGALYDLTIPYSQDTLADACLEVVRANRLEASYLRPVAFFDAAITRFSLACPELPDRIVERLTLGPRELEARFGITGGHIFHGEMLPGQLLERRIDRRAFGDVQRLYLGGSGAHPGGAVTGAPGYLAARAVIEDLAQ